MKINIINTHPERRLAGSGAPFVGRERHAPTTDRSVTHAPATQGTCVERGGDELRCLCGSLLARRVPGGVEVKCRRCKRSVVLAFEDEREEAT